MFEKKQRIPKDQIRLSSTDWHIQSNDNCWPISLILKKKQQLVTVNFLVLTGTDESFKNDPLINEFVHFSKKGSMRIVDFVV